jgi:hypothetical protein
LVGQRTGIIDQIRAFLLERGIAVRQGLRFLRAELPGILAKRTDVPSPRMRPWVVLIRPKSWELYGLKPWIEAASAARVGQVRGA